MTIRHLNIHMAVQSFGISVVGLRLSTISLVYGFLLGHLLLAILIMTPTLYCSYLLSGALYFNDLCLFLEKKILCYSLSEIWGISISYCLLNPELGISPLITAFSAPSVELGLIRILLTSANINCNTNAITCYPSFLLRDVISFKRMYFK